MSARSTTEMMPERIKPLTVVFKIIHVNDGGYCQQVQQVDSDGGADKERDKDKPAQGMRLVGLFLPFEHCPEHHCRKERRHGVNLAFYSREPESVGEAVGQRTYDAAGEHGPNTAVLDRDFIGFETGYLLAEQRDSPEKEHNAESAADGRHCVDGKSGIVGHQHSEQTADNLESGCSRRVSHLNFVGSSNVFSAVPPAGGRLGGHKVNGTGDNTYHPANQVVNQMVFFHLCSVF